MTIKELKDTFWTASADILSSIIKDPDRMIRWSYPTGGAPDWTIYDDILFLNLQEQDDEYAQQRDSVYETSGSSVIRTTTRTRVWKLSCTAYGPDSYEIVNRLKDGFFYDAIQRVLVNKSIAIIPTLPSCRRAPENFAGQWWDRWDLDLLFNEGYQLQGENVGALESIKITMAANRP